mmetsp:Transcript_22452/g.31501  ORF Transcript_22452/g.31501 Transcript_22452/m.31501 type:complete len:611 (+) Transcript_22452:216-2048(+)
MWIRGVNLGGWLLVERFITPYLFAITTCHIQGDFCWYPNQSSAPQVGGSAAEKVCDLYHCKPLVSSPSRNVPKDFPQDQYALMDSFDNANVRKQYMDYHWNNFVTHDDLIKLSESKITHVRVPIPFWILEDPTVWDTLHEPWVTGGWMYFIRLVSWCRKLNIKVWPDVHVPSSMMVMNHNNNNRDKQHMQRTLDALELIVNAIQDDGLDDVVTGIGILSMMSSFDDVSSSNNNNHDDDTLTIPQPNCEQSDMKEYYNEALKIVRQTLGEEVSIYQSDMWNDAQKWDDGWWSDEGSHSDTYLGSSFTFRSVETRSKRHLSPKQHIALVCQDFENEVTACCNGGGISRMVGEWSAAYDVNPQPKLQQVMQNIAKSGTMGEERTPSKERQDFLRQFVKAQMVTYEGGGQDGSSGGWFFYNFKMEGNVFVEYDYLQGLKDGWIAPELPSSTTSLKSRYGSCYDILKDTSDETAKGVVEEFPVPPSRTKYEDFDDDIVQTHGESLAKNGGGKATSNTQNPHDDDKLDTYDQNNKYDGYNGYKGGGGNGGSTLQNNNNASSRSRPKKEKKHSFLSFPMLWVIGFATLAIKYVFYSPRTYGYSNVSHGGGNAHTLYV